MLVVVGQPVKRGVEGPDEEVVPQLHQGQPQEVAQEEPGQDAAPKAHL